MVEIDWEKFIEIVPEALSEQEKDAIYETVAWYDPDANLSRKYLIHFIRVTQEILKFKFEQWESLTNELDEVATKQGKDVGNKLQVYIGEMERLREELDYYKKLERSSSRSTNVSNDEFKRELMKLKVENEELLGELKEKEREVMLEKKEVEKYAGQVVALEREKLELSRELKILQDEGAEKSISSLRDSPDESGAEKQEALTEMIRRKNKHISQLLEDIEVVENENSVLQAKISSIRDELAETTTHMSEVTAELSKLKYLNKEHENREIDFRDKINGLMFQIEELVKEKENHDKKLDEYILMFNSKVQEWEEILASKDDEIIKLNDEIKNICSSTNLKSNSEGGESKLSKKLLQQQEQIDTLQLELQKATEEINNSTDLIVKLKEKQMHFVSTSTMHTHSAANFFEQKIKVLEEKLAYAEEDARAKAEEMSNLVIQLREYESGIFGLSEAVEKIKKLEKNIQKKDVQTCKLIEICNNLEIKLDSFEEQNMALRDRLGLSASDEIDTSGITLRFKKDEELMENLKHQLDRKEEELLKIKLKYRKIITQFKQSPFGAAIHSRPVKVADSQVQTSWNKNEEEPNFKLQLIVRENDALRRGMHEILKSIREQDSSGTVEVQSTCLERLLEALDSRHVSGWYHPAMRLQAQLSSEEGKNDELRNQIRSLKAEEKKRTSELQNAYLKIQSLESDLSTPRFEEEKKREEEPRKEISTTDEEEIKVFQLDFHKSSMNFEQERRIIELESMLHEMRKMLDVKSAEFEKKERSFAQESEELLTKIDELESQLRLFKNGQIRSELLERAELTSQMIVLNRKVNYFKNLESSTNEANEKLKEELIDLEEKMLQEILKVQNQKLELLDKMKTLEESVLKSVPVEKFVSITNELAREKAKYKSAISSSLVLHKMETPDGNLERAVTSLESEKKCLLEELKKTKEKLIAAEALIREEAVTKGDFSNEISVFASNLAASEIRELNEKQKSIHLEKMNDSLRAQQKELEDRNKELVEKVEILTEENFKYQEVERELREKELKRFPEEDYSILEGKLEIMEKRLKEMAAEKDNVQELFEISQGQCRAFQKLKDSDQIMMASQKEQILLLQAGADEKAAISRLSHELATSKLLSSDLAKKNNDLKVKLNKLTAQNFSLEAKIFENSSDLFNAKRKHLTHVEHLHQTLREVRSLYGCGAAFRDVESVYNKKVELYGKTKKVLDKLNELKIQSEEYSLKKTELETQLESLEDLKVTLKGEAKNLVFWHNKSTESRLREARYRRRNEFLMGEVAQLKDCMRRLDGEITTLEEENMEREKEWERKQLLWEECQLEMCQLVGDKSFKNKGKSLRDVTTSTDDIVTGIAEERERLKASQEKVSELEALIAGLPKGNEGQNGKAVVTEKGTELNDSTDIGRGERFECAEKKALLVTVSSLESIIKQKEETILRYQDLLKERREDYEKAYSNLQDELKRKNESLAMQNRAYNKLKCTKQAIRFNDDDIPNVVEKYVTTIHELEEELRECQLNLTRAHMRACEYEQEMEKLRSLAEEKSSQAEDTKRRMEEVYRIEIGNYKEKIGECENEVERLMKLLESQGIDADAGETIESIQVKLPDRENDTLKSARSSKMTVDKCQKPKQEQILREVEALKERLRIANEESGRLKDEIKSLRSRALKRPYTTASSNLRPDSTKSSLREGNLTATIKNLEELLSTSKEREKELMEMNQKKLKSVEEVARWEERKKSQQSIKNLSSKLKEKEGEVEVLANKCESFRNMIHKCERDKSILESQLKSIKGGSGGINSRMEKLEAEKNRLEEEVNLLKSKLDEEKRNSSEIGAAFLREKLELQERKLACFELASKGHPAMVEELKKLKTANAELEKENLKLESENLSLQLKLEKEKSETNYLMEEIKHLKKFHEEVKRSEGAKITCHLKAMEKSEEENKRLREKGKETKVFEGRENLKKEMMKLRDENKLLREKISEATNKIKESEEELKSYRYQIHLMEEKDFAEVLSSRSDFLTTTCRLSQEITELKSKLAHKNHLLSRVRTLLIKAAAKEKALHEEVNFLQSLTPKHSSDARE